jgi:ABC-2 type transport system permease protein
MNKIGIIIAREFNERVRKKSFIITTILMPILMIGMMAAPTLMMLFAKGEQKTLLVIDQSGVVAQQLESSEDVEFKSVDMSLEEARQDADVFGVLWIGEQVVEHPADVKLYTNSSSSMSLEESITAQIEKVIERERLKRYDIEGLEDIMKNLEASVSMTTYRNDQSEEGKDEQATMVSIAGIVVVMLMLVEEIGALFETIQTVFGL